MPISKVLTVIKNFNGTDYWPNGSALSVDLTCTDNGVDKAARLSVVLVNLVNGTVQEVATYAAGAIAVTKITSGCTGLSAYVKEGFYDVYAAQNPCCGAAPAGNTTPPPPTVTADDTQGQDWVAASHALGISEILVADGSDPTNWIPLTSHPAWDAVNNRISVGNVNRASGYYAFKIKSAPGRNESAVALSPAFTAGLPQLGTPNAEENNVTANGFNINWGPVANATVYEWQVSTSNTFASIAASGNVNAPGSSFTFSGGTPNTQYWARVRATAPGYSPSNWDVVPVTTLESWDTILEFSTSTSDDAEGVGGTVAATGNVQEFAFNKIVNRTGTPSSMTIEIGAGNTEIVIDYPSDYNGQPFRYRDLSGTYRRGTFTNGILIF